MILTEVFAKLGLDVDEAAFNAADAAMSALGGGMAAIGAAVGAVAVGLAGVVGFTVKAASEFDDLNKRTGLATGALQELKYAGELSGVSLESITTGLQFLARNAVAAAGGSGEAQTAFKRLGVSFKDGNGKIRDADAMMMDAADALSKVESSSERTALAMQLFGRGGAAMLPMLAEGAAKLREQREEAQALGAVMSKDLIKSGDDLGDNFTSIQAVFAGFRNALAEEIIPFVNDAAKAFIAWAKANKQANFEKLKAVAKGLVSVLVALKDAAVWIADRWKLFAIILGGVALAAIIANAAALWGMVTAGVAAAAAGFMALLPWAALALGLILLGLIVEDLWVAFHGGDSLLKDLWEGWSKIITSWMDPPSASDGWLLNSFRTLMTMLTDFGTAWDTAVDFWKAKIMAFFGWIGEGFKAIPGMSLILGGGAVSPAASAGAAAGAAGVGANNFRANITINAPPGTSPEQVAEFTKQALFDFHDTKMREALGGT